MSWLEFMHALGYESLYAAILNHDINTPENPVIHERLLKLLHEYLAIGGMPEIVNCWVNTKNPQECSKLQHSIHSSAEIDYLIQHQGMPIPIEVKSGKGNYLTSMRLFLTSHQQSKFGIRFSTNNYSIQENLKSYPLYAIPLSLGVEW